MMTKMTLCVASERRTKNIAVAENNYNWPNDTILGPQGITSELDWEKGWNLYQSTADHKGRSNQWLG